MGRKIHKPDALTQNVLRYHYAYWDGGTAMELYHHESQNISERKP